MKLVKVDSTNIEQVGFDEGVRISLNQKPKTVLRIVFKSGMIYDYYDVPKDIYEGILNAHSVGKYFWANIKDRYSYEKVK